ncbi:MAG: hypothetical protein AAFY10_01140 [Pseudomonadota bacterium]
MVRIDANRRGLRGPSTGAVRVTSPARGRALSQLGASLRGVGDDQLAEIEAKRERDQTNADRVTAAKIVSENRLAWSTDLDASLKAYDGAQAGFADTFMEDIARRRDEALAGADERVRPLIELQFVGVSERLAAAALAGEEGKRQTYVMGGLRETLDTEAKRVLEQPDDLSGALENLDLLAESAPAGLRKAFAEEGRALLGAAYADKLMGEQPARLLSELNDGLLDGVYDAEAKAGLIDRAGAQVERNLRAAQQAREGAERERTARARDLSSRVVAYYTAGLAPPANLLEAAQMATTAADAPGQAERMALARYKAQRDDRKDAGDLADDLLDSLEEATESGLRPSRETVAAAQRAIQASGDGDLAARLNDIAKTAELRQEAAFMPRGELDALIETYRQSEVDPSEVNEFNTLRNVAAARARASDDAVGWAKANGMALTPVDLAGPGLVDVVARRVAEAEGLAEMTGEDLQIFSADERRQMAGALQALPPEERADRLARLVSGAGRASTHLIGELAEDEPYLGQAGYLTATGRGHIAVQAMEGMAAAERDGAVMPKARDLDALERSAAYGAIARPDVREAVIQTARGLLAGELARTGRTGEDFDVGNSDDAELYESMLSQAAGQVGPVGGIGEVRGQKILLPSHLSSEDVRGLMRGITPEEWTGWSFTGNAPAMADGQLASEALSARRLRRARLVSVGEGRYQVDVGDPETGSAFLVDSADPSKRYVLDLTGVNAGGVRRRRLYGDDGE